MATLVFKNTSTTTALTVDDLGIYLEPEEDLDLLLNFRDEDIIESQDLSTAMAGDAEVKLDGSTVMSYQDVIDYLTKLTHYDIIDYAYITSEDSVTDITAAELEALTDGSDITSHIHDNRYYTETELQTSGSALVHWGNLTNVPSMASVHWKAPVTTKSALPLTGNTLNDARIVQDDGDGSPAQYICVSTSGDIDDQWVKIADVDWGSASAIHVDATGNLSSTNVQDALEELQGDINTINGIFPTIDMDYVYNNGSTVTVDTTDVIWNMSDSRSFTIISDGGLTEVLDIAAASAGDTITINGNLDLNGGSFDLLGNSNSSIHTTSANLSLYTTTSGSITLNSAGSLTFKDQYLSSAIPLSEPGTSGLDASFSATSIVGAINELSGEITSVTVTLDGAYDGASGSGSGRTITADSGPVVINATTGTNAPLQLSSQSSAPSTNLAAGQLSVISGELSLYDATRSKWLSISEVKYSWSSNNIKGMYMKIGDALGTDVGFKVPSNSTIVKVSCSESTGSNREIQLRKNGTATSLKSFNLSSGSYTSTNDNIDLAVGDIIQAYVTGGAGSPCKDLVVNIFMKYRA